MKLIDQQSQELDQKKRLALVQQILKKLVPHHYLYTYGRMQDVWLDR